MPSELTSKTVHGLKWSYTSTITNAVLQIGYTAVMARLLEPKAFGLVAMGVVILRFGSYFAQMGMGQAIIQKKNISQRDIRSAFTSSVIISLLFFFTAYILAPYSLLIFNDNKLVPIIRLMSLSFVLTGLSTTSLALIRRELKFKSLAIIEITSYILGYVVVGIFSALSGFGVWSLVFASLMQAFVSAVLSYAVVRHNLRLLFNWKQYKPLLSFGSKISGITFFQFIGANLDTLLIGKLSGPISLGIYNRTSMLVNLPGQYLFVSLSKVLFPAFSQIQSDSKKLNFIYLNSLILLSVILIPVTLGLIPLAKNIVLILLGTKWIQAFPIFRILIFTVVFAAIVNLSGSMFQAAGKLKGMFIIEVINFITLGVLLVTLSKFGLIGFAFAVMVSRFIRFSLYMLVVNKSFGISFGRIFKVISVNIISGLMISGVLTLVTILLSNTNYYLTFIIQAITFILIYTFFFKKIALKYFNKELHYSFNLTSELFKKSTFISKIFSYLNKKAFPEDIAIVGEQ